MSLLPILIAFSGGLFIYEPPEAYEQPTTEPVLTAPTEAKADALAVPMFRDIVAEQAGNVVFSPVSAESLLHLLQGAAVGPTRAALMHLPMGERGVKTAMNPRQLTALYADRLLRLTSGQKEVRRVDFRHNPAAALSDINAWCRQQTEGRIPSLLSASDITPDMRLVALDALYLHEKWVRPFRPELTENAPFRKADGSTVSVPMMYQSTPFRSAEGADWVAVALFYRPSANEGAPGCFIGILPKGDARAFAAALTPQKYADIVHALALAEPKKTELYLPKFRVTTGAISLENALTRAGAGILFSDAAQFSFTQEAQKVDKVLQRCFVEVNEQGTEAAAVTAESLPFSAYEPEVPRIRFDKPFLWAIGDLTNGAAPWFMGLTEEP